jgi:hypothetical protein
LSLTTFIGASTAAQKPSIFGQTTKQQPSADGSFGLFGSQQKQQQQNPQSQQGNTGAFGNQPVFGQMNTVQPQQGGCRSTFTAYSSGNIYNTKQYLALLRLNSLLQDCLVVWEVICSEMCSSKAANHPHLVCLETRQQHLHQVVADSLVITPLARCQVYPTTIYYKYKTTILPAYYCYSSIPYSSTLSISNPAWLLNI